MSMFVIIAIALILIIILFLIFNKLFVQKREPISAGIEAPDFSLPDENGAVQTLSKMRGKKVVLYFYPKDFTPGCAQEACSIRDGYAQLQSSGIEIFGISYDSPQSHKKFKEEYRLPYSLLSDEGKHVAKLYGVRGVVCADRTTFLIDPSGMIAAVLKDVEVGNHAQQIIQAFISKNNVV